MTLSSFIKAKRDRSITFSVLTLFALGYIFYFSAHWLLQPAWAIDLIDWLSPSVGSLGCAAHVAKYLGNDPFPAQVVILYGVFGTIPWTLWFFYLFFRDRKDLAERIRKNFQRMPTKNRPDRLRILITVISLLTLGFVLYGFWFLPTPKEITWRDLLFHSSSFGSYMFLTGFMFIGSTAIPSAFILAFSVHQSNGDKND